MAYSLLAIFIDSHRMQGDAVRGAALAWRTVKNVAESGLMCIGAWGKQDFELQAWKKWSGEHRHHSTEMVSSYFKPGRSVIAGFASR